MKRFIVTHIVSLTIFSLYFLTRQFWVVIMITYQPFFIGGLDDVHRAKGSAFGAAAMFVGTFIGSIIGMVYECVTRRSEVEHASSNNSSRLGFTMPAYVREYGRVDVDSDNEDDNSDDDDEEEEVEMSEGESA